MDNLKLKDTIDTIDTMDNVSEQIAIIGMTGRFPGAKNIEEFWRNLRDGVESITFFTREDLEGTNIDQSLLTNPRYVGADGVIDNMDMFDAGFFNITPREAELMDPQHRLFLECAWELMELAGYDSESYDGRVAVYGSANVSTYLIRNVLSNPELNKTATSFQTMITNDKDFVATRVSYKMNLTGPSMSVATLCSSSSLAIHLACQALLNYQCDLGLAGAISLQVSRNEAFFYQEGGIGDPDGHCRAFDAGASGTVSGSGIGLIAVKRLKDALEDGDTIHAVIRATAVNNDGALKYSYTAPSIEGQSDVIAEAISLAEVDPETITYIETHGTGTRLGDPIEITALTKAFRGCGARKNQYCAIGSVKTNIGHLVNAGGVASLIKTVLAVKHSRIPASLNFETPNPEIDFENSPFFVNTELRDWQPDGAPRRAGVSSFGIGGTNVHIVVEEAPEIRTSGEARAWQLLVLSAKTGTALEAQTANMLQYLKTHPDANLADVAYTLQVGRRAFSHRRMLLCRNRMDAISKLVELQPEHVYTQFQESRNRPAVFLFPGTVPIDANPGKKLYQQEPVFRRQVDECSEHLRSLLNFDLRTLLYPVEDAGDTGHESGQPGVTNAAAFVLEYALGKLFMEWGVSPKTMVGEGVGNYVAGCLSGELSREDALTLAVGYEQSSENASQNRGVVEELLKKPEQVLLEVGFHKSLSVQALEHPEKPEHQVIVPSLQPLGDYAPEMASLLKILGTLWLAGVKIDWNGVHAHTRRNRLPLPTYPFERKRYWIEPGKGFPGEEAHDTSRVSKKPDIAGWLYLPSWKRTLWPVTVPQKTKNSSSWLLFADEEGLGMKLAGKLEQRLKQEGQRVLIVTATTNKTAIGAQHPLSTGPGFEQLGDDSFCINPGQRSDYSRLLKKLSPLAGQPLRILHLWSVTGNGEAGDPVKQTDVIQDRGFYSLLYLAQALGEYHFTGEVVLTVVSNNMCHVADTGLPCAEKATLLGPVKVIPQEYPNITCRSIDIRLPEEGSTQEHTLIERLLADITGHSSDLMVTYRGGQRWVQTFKPVHVPEAARLSIRFREKGVYLIPGGLSEIGIVLAGHLAETCKARLVLITSKEFPSREAWGSWEKTHTPSEKTSIGTQPMGSTTSNKTAVGTQRMLSTENDRIYRLIKKLQAFEAHGAKVLIMTADVTSEEQMKHVINRAEDCFGRLNGVIYAANSFGETALGLIKETGTARCRQQLQATMRGAAVLASVLTGKEIDWCMLMSSLSSVLGGLGLVTYSAASNFLDIFACRNALMGGVPWMSINWDNWKLDDTSGDLSMRKTHLDRFSITPEEGIDAFERILSCDGAVQMLVSTVDLHYRLEQWITRESREKTDSTSPGKQVTAHARPDLMTPYVAPRNDIEQTLVEIMKPLIGLEKIGINDDFFHLDVNSFQLVQLVIELEKKGFQVAANDLYKYPTIRELSSFLQGNIPENNNTPETQAVASHEIPNKDYSLVTETGVKILPVKYPPVSAFPDIANLLSILCNDSNTLPWIYNHYINIEGPPKENLETCYYGALLYIPVLVWEMCPFIRINTIDRALVELKWKSISEFFIDCIDKDNYINLLLDRYYIPCAPEYQKTHNDHKTLIFGYDLVKKVFYAADFYEFSKYSYVEIGISSIEEAYYNHQGKDPGFIRLIKRRENVEYRFDTGLMIEFFHDYLLSRNPREKYSFPQEQAGWEYGSYGMELYETLWNYLELYKTEKKFYDIYQKKEMNMFDGRGFYSLLDHKKLMLLRLQYLNKAGFLEKAIQICNDYSQIVNMMENIGQLLMKFFIVGNKELLSEVQALLLQTAEKERIILETVLDNIKLDDHKVIYQKIT